MRRSATAFGSGLLFGAGLLISGMVDPRNVIGFLDFAGRWNPMLAAVMIGAVGTHGLLLRLLRRPAPVAAAAAVGLASYAAQPATIDARLVLGAAIFGVGWGLSGYCPGPAVVALGLGVARAWAFVAALIAGAVLADSLGSLRSAPEPLRA